MDQNYYLCGSWCVWLNYQVPEELLHKIDYNDYLKKVITISSYNDLAYYWQESPLKDPHYFLVHQSSTPNQNNYPRFEIEGESRNISAINYFREGINPTWEDLNNKYGGRLIFQIDKDVDKYQEIYEWLIFYFLGQSQSCAEDINGVRFITHKANAPFKYHYRVEVWTKFSLKQQQKVQLFRDTFVKDFFNSFLVNNPKLQNFKPSFKNNEEAKDKREQNKAEEKKEEDANAKN